jgi:putative transposon-encoded protein
MVIEMRRIKLNKTRLQINDEITVLFEKTVTKFGTGAKIDCPKDFIGKKVYVLVRKD